MAEARDFGWELGAKRATGRPERSTRNFVKFHLMRRVAKRPGFCCLRKAKRGWVWGPLTWTLEKTGKLTP